MPNSRRQSAIESQPNPSSNPSKTTPSSTAHQPTAAGARLESSINRKFHALGTPTNATNASTPSRNSISRAALASEPRSLPKHTNHNHVNNDTATTQSEATIGNHNKPSSLTGSKKQNSRAAAGLGLPSSTTGTIPAKRNLTTSDIPSSTSNNNKKNKQDAGAQSKNEKNLTLSVDTLRCHQCRAEVPLENVIMCSNENCARTIPRKRRSESGLNPSAKSPSTSLQAPCRISFCGRCLSARYGEDLKKVRPTVNALYEWDCPVCQDYCNCSICRKKKGLPPTGKLAKVATQAGFSSARELLAANPNAQGPDILNQEAKKKQSSSSTATSQVKPKPDGTNKKLMKLKTPGSLTPKSKKPMATTTNKLMTKKTNHKKKMSSQDPKHLEVVKKLKKQQQLGKSKPKKSDPSSSSASCNKQASASSKQAPSAPLVNGNNKVTDPPAGAEVIAKAPGRRAPHVVQAPVSYSCIPTGILSSAQILKRLHVREFICRFKDLIPGLGATEAKNSRTESQRAEKIIDSMDDLVNFWIDDEGGMRAIMNGLTRLIEADFNLVDQSTGDRPSSSSPILKSAASPALLAQLKRECKNSSTPIPYHQNSVPCWNTAINLLKEEGLESTFEKDTQDPYISSVDGSPTNEHSGDERLQRVKFPPVKKLAIITALIDIALRGHTLCEDLIQGLEREKQAKSDILKERVKSNKKWTETKAQKMSTMPSKKSLLVTSEDGQMIQKPSKTLVDQEAARVQALAEWEADMNQAECAHKDEIRKSFIDQYKVESLNRLRFQSIGQDSRKNTYYILSSTPGVLYPNDPIELAYSWSYSLIIHGSEPTNLKKKKSQASKKTNQSATTATTSSATDSSMVAGKAEQHEETQIDMLEGGQRAPNDQWIRISEPKEIRQLASWIEYEAKLIDFKNSINSSSSSSSLSGPNKKTPNSNTAKQQTLASLHPLADTSPSSLHPSAIDTCSKSVANLVELVNRFSEFLDLKISQHRESTHNDRRGLKSRNHS
ncbi:uncharacterized protein PGTG_10202 [Puccinia graminis f. sp. tritici CRL 75-36-700-3]|uniref:Zinc-finger domain-containing protein n=1 Tax=Puccinia graminis f. sp. tritici (strain CRL 75-36-700-3 / race SCCL) TaxID=418459 RepID=E3KJK7_PUCGT|nr:uncharacterized protein PGTG_10202 [Puccinia graminis f. sp. tritici CRL 75-36-700-3]EFP84482.1 hypothetical protein PGTG_10202 [Puccinia graminis f. sp. tritici CRL 75-36-700-3]